MKRASFFPAAFLALLVCGCFRLRDRPSESPIHRYGLSEAKLYRPMVARAIQLANSLLQNDVSVKLAPGWDQTAADGTVPVFLVREYNLSQQDMIFVPEHERFVLVNERQLLRFLDRTRTKDSNYSPVLALMLLHEVGHIVRGEWGSYEHHDHFELTDLIGDHDPQHFDKNPELAADMFAAFQVRTATHDSGTATRFAAGVIVGSSITLHQFSVFSERLLDNFLKLSLDHFLDSGYTHPNYELRLLVILYLVNRDEHMLQLLTDFMNKRKAARAERMP